MADVKGTAGHFAAVDLNKTEFEKSEALATRWQGSNEDRHDMAVLGRVQQLRRNFHMVSLVGFASTLICTWEIIVTNLNVSLMDGGASGLIWGFLLVAFGYSFVYTSVAEMASMAPTSGGQYHWVSEFAPRSCQKYLSYLTGWLCFTGWQTSIVAIAYLAGTLIQGLIALNNPDYVFERWQGTLLIMAISVIATFFNTFLAKKLPLVEWVFLFVHIAGLFGVACTLWVWAPRATSASDVFLNLVNTGGWPTTGTAFIVGLYTPIPSMMGFDSIVHMSEEVHDAGTTIPRTLMITACVNFCLGLVMVITVGYTVGDLESVLGSSTGFPIIQMLYNATDNVHATNFLTALIIIALTSSVIAEVSTSSRQLWAFARDNGVPFSRFFAHVAPGWDIPLNAVLVSLVIAALLALVNIDSSVALQAIFSLSGVSLVLSYCTVIACVILRRLRGLPLPERRWSLGRAGLFCNIAALCYLVPLVVFLCFPIAIPVDPSTMNWASMMFGAIFIFSTVFYVTYGRRVYTPPVSLVRRGKVHYASSP